MRDDYIIERVTKETDIYIRINFNENINMVEIKTGIPFFDHMLEQFCFHGGFSLRLKVRGDLNVDNHHVVEDTGIALGKIFRKIFKHKIYNRYCYIYVPMDESLTRIVVDICNRPNLIFNVSEKLYSKNGISISNVFDFFKSFTDNSFITMHVENYGKDVHHKIESIFKAFGLIVKKILRLEMRKYFRSTKDI